MEKWVDNSCSVIFKCRDGQPQNMNRMHRRFQQLFQIGSDRIIRMVQEIIREIWEDENRASKNR